MRRVLHALPLLLGIVVVNFTLIHLAPGDPISVLAGDYQLSEEQIQSLRRQMGLDRPLPVQLALYIWSLLAGDLGYSYVLQQPVLHLILDRMPATVLLMLTALSLYSLAGVAFGVLASLRPRSLADHLGTVGALIGYSIPVFWLGQMALLLFALWLDWLPTQGMYDVRRPARGVGWVLDVAWHLILPATVLGMRYMALNTRLTRASMLEELQQDYVVTARAKGLGEPTVVRHALANAMLPTVTMFGVNLGLILAGSVLTEIVFGWPGLGQLTYNAIYTRDHPLLMGLLLVVSFGVILANLITDLLYEFLDPRIRLR